MSIFFIMYRYVFSIICGFTLINFTCFCETLGDRILQSREAQLNSINDNLSPLKERKVTSALANVARIDDSVTLVDPKEGLISFTLLEAIKRSLEKSFLLQNAQLKIKNADSSKRLVNKFQDLNVDLKMGFGKAGNLGDDSRDSYHRHLTDLSNLEDSFHIGLDFDYPLIDGGKSAGEIDTAKIHKKLIEIDTEEEKHDLLKHITHIFIQIILIQERLDIAAMAVEMSRYQLLREEKKPSSDPRMPVDLLAAKLKLEKELQNEFSLRNELRDYQSSFRNLVGLEQDKAFGIDKNAKTRAIKDPLETLKTLAKNNALKLKRIKLNQEKQNQAYRIIKSQQLPFVDLYAKTHYARLADRADLHEMRFNFGLKFDMNLFDGRHTATQLQMNERYKTIYENEFNEALLTVLTDVSKYFRKFVDLRSRIAITQNNLKLARSVLYEAEERFQKKQVNKYQLLDNRITFKESLLQYYKVLGELIETKLNLFELTGQLNENIFG